MLLPGMFCQQQTLCRSASLCLAIALLCALQSRRFRTAWPQPCIVLWCCSFLEGVDLVEYMDNAVSKKTGEQLVKMVVTVIRQLLEVCLCLAHPKPELCCTSCSRCCTVLHFSLMLLSCQGVLYDTAAAHCAHLLLSQLTHDQEHGCQVAVRLRGVLCNAMPLPR